MKFLKSDTAIWLASIIPTSVGAALVWSDWDAYGEFIEWYFSHWQYNLGLALFGIGISFGYYAFLKSNG